jgi:hypothetical protein
MKTANEILHGLLTRFEKNGGRIPRPLDIGHAAMKPEQADSVLKGLRAAEAEGAVGLRFGKYERSHLVERIHIKSESQLYSYLRREPRRDLVEAALRTIRLKLESEEIKEVLDHIFSNVEEAWCRHRQHFGLSLDEADKLSDSIRFCLAIYQSKLIPADLRTCSVRFFGNSKRLEMLVAPVAAIFRELYRLQGLDKDQVLQWIGLSKDTQFPVLVRGPISLVGGDAMQDLGTVLPYLGIAAERAADIRVSGQVQYVITIENLTSFKRYAREVSGSYVALYTGGIPAPNVRQAIEAITRSSLDQIGMHAPVYHWGDMDQGGIAIFLQIEKLLDRPLTPHLMEVNDANRYGTQCSNVTSEFVQGVPEVSTIYQLADALARSGAKRLEQEFFDPVAPL